VDVTDSLEQEPKQVSKEGKMRPCEEGDHIDLCESASSPTSVQEVGGFKAIPQEYNEDAEQVYAR
jgi:hypothetical protein